MAQYIYIYIYLKHQINLHGFYSPPFLLYSSVLCALCAYLGFKSHIYFFPGHHILCDACLLCVIYYVMCLCLLKYYNQTSHLCALSLLIHLC